MPKINQNMKQEIAFKQVFAYIVSHCRHFPVQISVMFWVAIVWALTIPVTPYLHKTIINRLSFIHSGDVLSQLWLPVAGYLIMHLALISAYRMYDYFIQIQMIPRMRERIASMLCDILVRKNHSPIQVVKFPLEL